MQVDEGWIWVDKVQERRQLDEGGYGFRVHNDIMTLEGSEGVRTQ